MSDPINQHHVPRIYLKNFSVKRKEVHSIYAYDKLGEKIFSTNIENVASERHFYTVKNLTDIYVWEKFYSEKIEPLMKTCFSRLIYKAESCLIKDKVKVLDDKDKVDLAIIMICQLLRGKQAREYAKKIFDENLIGIQQDIKNKWKERSNDIDKLLDRYQLDDNAFKSILMDVVLDSSRVAMFAQTLLDHCWVIYRINGELEFVTSDNPVMFMDKSDFNVKPFHNGITNSSTVVFYPISSKLLLVLYDKSSLFEMINNYDSRIVFLDDKKDLKFVTNINKKQVEQCNRHVFAKSETIVEKCCEM